MSADLTHFNAASQVGSSGIAICCMLFLILHMYTQNKNGWAFLLHCILSLGIQRSIPANMLMHIGCGKAFHRKMFISAKCIPNVGMVRGIPSQLNNAHVGQVYTNCGYDAMHSIARNAHVGQVYVYRLCALPPPLLPHLSLAAAFAKQTHCRDHRLRPQWSQLCSICEFYFLGI